MESTVGTPAGRPLRDTAAHTDALLDVMFSTAKDLRHQAEQIFGRLFVPTEVRHLGDQTAHLVLHLWKMAEVHVHATRERNWHRYRIARVEVVDR